MVKFDGGDKPQAFPWAVVELFFDQPTLLQSQCFETLALLEILTDQSVGVLTEPTLP